MNIELDPKKIAQLLTQSTRQLDPTTLSLLENARQNVLQRRSVREPVFAPASGRWTQSLVPHSIQQWAAAGLLAVMLVFGTGYWLQSQEQQISELDVAILTDELPIEVFLD